MGSTLSSSPPFDLVGSALADVVDSLAVVRALDWLDWLDSLDSLDSVAVDSVVAEVAVVAVVVAVVSVAVAVAVSVAVRVGTGERRSPGAVSLCMATARNSPRSMRLRWWMPRSTAGARWRCRERRACECWKLWWAAAAPYSGRTKRAMRVLGSMANECGSPPAVVRRWKSKRVL